MIDTGKAGFSYTFEIYDKQGRRVSVDEGVLNRMPLEGIEYMQSVALLGGSEVTTWYLGLFGNNYTPQPGDTAATFPALAGEITSYTSALRHTIPFAQSSPGITSNDASPISVEFAAGATVRGGFIVSAGPKGSTSGLLLSAVLLPTPRVIPEDGGTLVVRTGLHIVS